MNRERIDRKRRGERERHGKWKEGMGRERGEDKYEGMRRMNQRQGYIAE